MANAPVRGVIFDWAGTTVDFGSRGPTQVFVELFRRRGVAITVAEAREPMGRAKLDHIATIMAMPRVATAWRQVHDSSPTESDVQRLYAEFLPMQKEALLRHADVIPGVPEVVAELRRRGVKIGSTTGYTRELMDVLAPAAREGGFAPDHVICADDVPAGRPAPWMLFRSAERLNVYPMSHVAVVDDTPVGIEAARNAGALTIGVTLSGNALGLAQAEVQRLPAEELRDRLEAARQSLLDAGAHVTIDTVADLLKVSQAFQPERLSH